MEIKYGQELVNLFDPSLEFMGQFTKRNQKVYRVRKNSKFFVFKFGIQIPGKRSFSVYQADNEVKVLTH